MSRKVWIEPWLSEAELLEWMRDATSRQEYQRRLAVWLTYLERIPAHQVATMLGVSKQAVWLWISQYNKQGPEGLKRKGRGGRRWAFLSLERERELLVSFQKEAAEGKVLTAKQLHAHICEAVGKRVSIDYVYSLMHRHGWRKMGPRPQHVRGDPAVRDEFKKNSRI